MDQDGIVCCGGNELEIRPAAGQKLGDEAADFRLMAAAPELLEALKVTAEALAHCMGNEYAPVVEARAAIAKAERTTT